MKGSVVRHRIRGIGSVVVASGLLVGCVFGGRARPGREAVRLGPMEVDEPSAASHWASLRREIVSVPPTGAEGAGPPNGHYMRPHVHWSGVEYVLVEGQWEPRDPSYVWKPR